MDERVEMDKADEVMLPGFRFHPTDEELVGFYLKRKIQQKPLSIELIRQLDIYKYDPWDLPKLATIGEKEWYFYCPRDRKYRNSARPNRVTRAGFWKATGTDRPVYSSEGTRCIGLKKSLVFYKGRAAKGIKTDWMMHEFRLPSLTDSSLLKRPWDKIIPAIDYWAICRIFKKTNSMAQRVISHSWGPRSSSVITGSDLFSVSQTTSSTSMEAGPAIQFSCSNGLQHLESYNLINRSAELPTNLMFSPAEISAPSMLLNLSPRILDVDSKTVDFGQQQNFNGSEIDLALEELSVRKIEDACFVYNSNEWGSLRTVGFPFNLPPNLSDEWKPSLQWDSLPLPSEMSTSYSSNK